MFASVDLGRVKAARRFAALMIGVTGLAGDRGSVGTVAAALGDIAGTEGIFAEFGDGSGAITSVLGTVSDGLVYRCPGRQRGAEVAVPSDGRKQRRTGSGASYPPTAQMAVER